MKRDLLFNEGVQETAVCNYLLFYPSCVCLSLSTLSNLVGDVTHEREKRKTWDRTGLGYDTCA